MKNYILTSLLVVLCAQQVFALDVVYPKKNEVTIESQHSYFVGNTDTNKDLKINGKLVPVHKSGGFVYPVDLDFGANEFVLESGNETQIFRITNPKIDQPTTPVKLSKTYSEPKFFITAKDNVPLRSTPIDGGINRIAHYHKGIPLKVIGEDGEFYKVELNSNKYAWISYRDVELSEKYEPSKILKKDAEIQDEYFVFKLDFDKKVPYVIEGGYPFVVKFYNVDGEENNTFTFMFPHMHRLAGYSGNYDGNTFVLKIRKFPEINDEKPLQNIKVVVDAGHGGDEIGAIGCLRHKEKDINLAIAKNLSSELKSRGAKVIMTRKHDETVALYDRVKITNDNDGMIFLSIHGNALPDNMNPLESSGTSIYYYYPQAKPLADAIMKEMNEQLPLNDDKVRKGSLAVVRNTNALSVLIEVAYLINPEDNAMLIDKNFQKNAAKAIADGVEEFLKN